MTAGLGGFEPVTYSSAVIDRRYSYAEAAFTREVRAGGDLVFGNLP